MSLIYLYKSPHLECYGYYTAWMKVDLIISYLAILGMVGADLV